MKRSYSDTQDSYQGHASQGQGLAGAKGLPGSTVASAASSAPQNYHQPLPPITHSHAPSASVSHATPPNASSRVNTGSATPGAQAVAGSQDHVPKISRKIRACKECQSRKVRCDGQGPTKKCNRCQRLGLQCVVNKSLQTLLEDESGWKNNMEDKLEQLQAAVTEVLRRSNMPSLDSFGTEDSYMHASDRPDQQQDVKPNRPRTQSDLTTSPQDNISPRNYRQVPGMAMTRENSPITRSRDEDENATLTAAPMASLFEVTKLRNLRNNPNKTMSGPDRSWLEDDFISQGKVTESEATELFRYFDTSLNHYLWGGIALVHDNLTSVRKSSSVLTAAILTVTALHIPGKEAAFDVCYAEFLSLVADSMFDRYHSLDDVRGFCIGAFWLSDVSWKLSGHAVRIATELLLHQSFAKVMKGSQNHLERARLWYFLYVCDHHFSIAYGRPPVISEDIAITNHEHFLQLPGTTAADDRLHSQVGVFIILSKIYDTFAQDNGAALDEEGLKRLRQFNYDLDVWRNRWEPRLTPNPYISNYPAKGVHLHHNFARLQLNSLALRAISHIAPNEMSPDRREFASAAITSAVTILDIVLHEPDIRKSVVGVPLYLHTNITFAAVFLLKVQLQWRSAQLVTHDPAVILSLIEDVIKLLSEAQASKRHLTYHIANGLSNMLEKFKERGMEINNGRMPSNSVAQNVEQGTHMPVGDQTAWQQQQQPQIPMNPGDMMYADGMNFFSLDTEYFPMGIYDALASQIPN